jgi:hypothetical protein
VPKAQSAQEVIALLPADLVELLAAVSNQPDDVILHALEDFEHEVGLRGLFLNTGMAENSRSCQAINMKLRPFGREVAQECRRWLDEHHADDVPSVLARLRQAQAERTRLQPATVASL